MKPSKVLEHPEAPKITNRYLVEYQAPEYKQLCDLEYEFLKKGSQYPEHEALIKLLEGWKIRNYLKTEIIAAKSEHKYYAFVVRNIAFYVNGKQAQEARIKDLKAVLDALNDEIQWLQTKIESL